VLGGALTPPALVDAFNNLAITSIFTNHLYFYLRLAVQALSPLIHVLGGALTPPALVDAFVTAHILNENEVAGDTLYHCAFNFPAVLLALSAEKWPVLASAHAAWCNSAREDVRKTLSKSLHAVAGIVGAAVATEALVPRLHAFLEDTLQVRVCVCVCVCLVFFYIFRADFLCSSVRTHISLADN
jgi:hypothetical protein